jgi:hypothetical protein
MNQNQLLVSVQTSPNTAKSVQRSPGAFLRRQRVVVRIGVVHLALVPALHPVRVPLHVAPAVAEQVLHRVAALVRAEQLGLPHRGPAADVVPRVLAPIRRVVIRRLRPRIPPRAPRVAHVVIRRGLALLLLGVAAQAEFVKAKSLKPGYHISGSKGL